MKRSEEWEARSEKGRLNGAESREIAPHLRKPAMISNTDLITSASESPASGAAPDLLTPRFPLLASSDRMHSIDILRFNTSGSVDDGKSTLIGRLLYDSKSLMEARSGKRGARRGASTAPSPAKSRPAYAKQP